MEQACARYKLFIAINKFFVGGAPLDQLRTRYKPKRQTVQLPTKMMITLTKL